MLVDALQLGKGVQGVGSPVEVDVAVLTRCRHRHTFVDADQVVGDVVDVHAITVHDVQAQQERHVQCNDFDEQRQEVVFSNG